MSGTPRALGDVWNERDRQDERWGEQNHPLIGPYATVSDYENAAQSFKRMNNSAVRAKILSWDGILLEEVYEALAETDSARMRAELIQVAAVAVAMVEMLDRQAAAEVSS